MVIEVPAFSLVLLVGASGSGKSTFARKHFAPYEVISSDECRGIVSNDPNDQASTNEAFELLHYIVGMRLKRGLLTVVDATNVQSESRAALQRLAKEYHALTVAIVLDMPQVLCEERNASRPDRDLGPHVLRSHVQQLRKSLRSIRKERFQNVVVLSSIEEVEAVESIVRRPLYNDKRDEHGPFDIIGDIHGCFVETKELLSSLGYTIEVAEVDGKPTFNVTHPEGRRAVFLGDLVDRGPDSPSVLRLVMSMVRSGVALCVPGNHDVKLQNMLAGKKVNVAHGLEKTLEQLESESDEFRAEVREFLYSLISHYVLDDGKLVVAHAGLREDMQGRGSGAVRAFCLYGETTGETDEFGLPVRYDWASEYRGKAQVVYGHTPIPEPQWLNRTINIDTGCVFGGRLTALRYPEGEIVSVPAQEVYAEPIRPMESADRGRQLQHIEDDALSVDDVIGKRIVQTRLRKNITIREENSIAALEVMSRYAINPKWLIYLPPTMSPCETSSREGFLEHPDEAFSYYRKHGVKQVICEEKHMGSRGIIVVCHDSDSAHARFGTTDDRAGVIYTRTGRPFFADAETERALIDRVRASMDSTRFWEKHDTTWACLDVEILPWSAKAQALLKDQYAAVGAAALPSLSRSVEQLTIALERGIEGADDLLARYTSKLDDLNHYIAAYQQYCWTVESVDDYKIAPFHLLATEGCVHIDKTHVWHMEELSALVAADANTFRATEYRIVDLEDEASVAQAIAWWLSMTGSGGEGMVVKPVDFVRYDRHDIVQPAIKCRGRDYLRIIYGPEYTQDSHLNRLRKRGLSTKRSLALREFALGVEALERFVAKEPLRRVHESVFGVLAMESEEVDPRL